MSPLNHWFLRLVTALLGLTVTALVQADSKAPQASSGQVGLVLQTASSGPGFIYRRVMLTADASRLAKPEHLFVYVPAEGSKDAHLVPYSEGTLEPEQIRQAQQVLTSSTAAIVNDLKVMGELVCVRMPLPAGFTVKDPETGKPIEVGGGFALLSGFVKSASGTQLLIQRNQTGVFGADQVGRVVQNTFVPPDGTMTVVLGDRVWISRALWPVCPG